MGRNELGTRFVFGPLMLLTIWGIYYSDQHWTATPDGHGGKISAGLLGVMAVVGVLEYVAMFRKAGFPVASTLLVGFTTALCGSAFFFGWQSLDRELYPLVIGTLALLFPLALRGLAPRGMGHGLEEMGGTLLGFLLVAWPLYLAQGIALRHLESLFFVVLVSKFGDIGAYLTGVAFGRRKLIPHVSPGKTIEGALGSVVMSCAMSVWLSSALLAPEVKVTLTGAVLIGIMLNVTTQIGDLVESLLKRRCDVKDSSTMLPAHGGVLDLVDSLLFSFPAYFLVLTILTGPPSS